MPVQIDPDRFERTFEEYSQIGATENDGLHRLALTDEDAEARDRFVSDLEALDLDVWTDEIGNVFGRRAGRDPDAEPVLLGSHLDSQPYGGRYDGQLGVLTALETLRALEDADVETERPVEIVNWTNEEGSRFNQAMLGSSVFVGEYDVDEAKSLEDPDGRSLAEELTRTGYDGDTPCEPRDLHAYLELHIEQGPKLENAGVDVGVVDGVFGMAWLEATVHGEADHAGPTTMDSREDALAAAAEATAKIHALPNRLSPDAVSTVGRMEVSPNSINVIPERVTFTVDVRSYDDDAVEQAVDEVEFEIEAACTREGASFELDRLWSITHTEFSPEVRQTLAVAAEQMDVSYQNVRSGAGHDASYLNRVTNAGMLFVPSVDGKTHTEAEFTRWEDAVAGARVYANAVLRLAGDEE